jgi:muconolactone delta-isomerase
MPNPMIRIHNTETDEVIDREMTDEEYADFQAREEAFAQELADKEAAKAVKESAYAKLGLTAEEIAALLG